jgi:PLU-1-like protein
LKAKKSRFQQINSLKLSYENLKKLLEEIQEQPFICEAIEAPIQEEIEKVENWKKTAQQRPLTAMQLKALIDNSNELIVKVEELDDLLMIFDQLQIWQNKYNNLQSKITENTANVEEARKLLSEAESLKEKIDFTEAFENLTKKVEKTDVINSKLLKLIEKPMEYTIWVKFQKDLVNIELKSEIIEMYHNKIQLCKDILHLLHKRKASLENLNEALIEANKNNIDEKIISEIKLKIQKLENLNEKIMNFPMKIARK